MLLLAQPAYAATIVEVTLVDKLDEPRGFCLDIVGSQRRAAPAQGLQAHTCYSYQGKLAVDQGFVGEGLKNGEFRLPWFNACLTRLDGPAASTPSLRDCDGGPRQRFHITISGHITPESDSTLCLTVDDTASRPGGGGKPPHLIRSLMFRACAVDLDKFQKWRIREKAD